MLGIPGLIEKTSATTCASNIFKSLGANVKTINNKKDGLNFGKVMDYMNDFYQKFYFEKFGPLKERKAELDRESKANYVHPQKVLTELSKISKNTNPRYKADASNVKRNAKRSGRDWRPTTTCWHLTYKSKATKEITKEIAGEKKHPAIFPEELVEKCIKVSGLKEGTMFDCFAGTGTSLLVAKKMGLDYFGCDLDKDYVEFMKSRMSKEEVWDKFGG